MNSAKRHFEYKKPSVKGPLSPPMGEQILIVTCSSVVKCWAVKNTGKCTRGDVNRNYLGKRIFLVLKREAGVAIRQFTAVLEFLPTAVIVRCKIWTRNVCMYTNIYWAAMGVRLNKAKRRDLNWCDKKNESPCVCGSHTISFCPSASIVWRE